jgi:hypothetical protein
MTAPKSDVYLTCDRRKGQPKKHIDVCRRCRWQKGCKIFQRYSQPELPIRLPSGKGPQESPPDAAVAERPAPAFMAVEDSPPPADDRLPLLLEVKKGLEELRKLLG